MGAVLNLLLLITIGYTCGNFLPEEVQKLSLPSYFAVKVQDAFGRKTSATKCELQLLAYAKALLALEPWAIRMFDASGKIPAGILEGNIDMGAFDECIQVEVPEENILGQYCIGDITLNMNASLHYPATLHNISFLHEPNAVRTRAVADGIKIKLAICIPNECPAMYLPFIFKQFGLNVEFSKDNCQTMDSQPKLDLGAIITIAFFGTMLAVVIFATLYHAYQNYLKRDLENPVLNSFSILTNGKKLLSTSKNPEIISCMHGMRFLSTLWVIQSHTYTIWLHYPLQNPAYAMEKWKLNVGNMFILSDTVSVDTFFLMGGVALVYSYLVSRRKGKQFNIPLFYIHRYLRLTPALAVVVLFHLTLLKYMGSGPFWPHTLKMKVESCEKNWWKTLLYVENYSRSEHNCVKQAWYLSADFQLYLLSPILLLPLVNWPKMTLIGTGILTVLSMTSCFLAGWIYDIYGPIMAHLDPELSRLYMFHYYNPTHTRAAVWLIGVLYGYLIFKVNDKNCKFLFNKVLIITLWLVSLALLCTCIFAGHHIIVEPESSTKIENLFYLTFVRPVWGMAVGWIIFACFTGYGGPVNWFLSLPMFEVLGKLNYSIYLVHLTILYVHVGQLRSPGAFGNFNQMYIFWGGFAFSVFIALMLYFVFEYPIAVLEQLLFSKREGNKNNHVDNGVKPADIKDTMIFKTKSQYNDD